MAQKQLLQLPKTQFSGLEYANILEDVYNMVKQTPEYNENWDDFLSSDAGVMLTEIYAWITDQLATRIDWVVNENFIGTATQRSSIINLLKLIGYKFELPAAANVPVTVGFNRQVGTYILTPEYNPNVGQIFPKTLLAKDKKGKIKFFEALLYDVVTEEYLYKLPVEVDTTVSLSQNVTFHEGQTKIENFVSPSNSGQVFPLSENPVIRNSVTVFQVFEDGGTGDISEVKLLEVDSFLSLEAQQYENTDGTTNAIPYVVNVLENDAVEIAFGSSSLLADPNRRLDAEANIRIFYRIGGGTTGEIARGAIDVSEDTTNLGTPVTITYYNGTEGVGAEDSETLEHAAYVGPLQIKTAGKTVTEEDYDIILSSFISVLLSKAYGHNNLPENYFEKYGTYISPLEVLNFILMRKSGWESIPTSKYKYANWGTLNLQNYFNEKIAFKEGSFGNISYVTSSVLTLEDIYDYDNQGGRTFNNFIVIKTLQDWKDNLWIEDPDNPGSYIANVNAKGSLTNDLYDPLVDVTIEDIDDYFVTSNDGDSFFYGDYNDTGLPRPVITEDISAYMESLKDTTSGIYIGLEADGPNLLLLNIDNHGEVNIDLSVNGIYEEVVAQTDIRDTINNAIGTAYNGVYSYQDFGVQIPDTSAVMETVEDLDYDNWLLNVRDGDGGALVSFSVDLGSTQTYDDLLVYMNNSFDATGTQGYQEFADVAPWVIVDAEVYDFNITIDGVGPTLVTLPAVTGTSLSAEDLKALINTAFTNQGMIGQVTAEIAGTAVRISSLATGITSAIDITAGTVNDLLVVTGVMQGAIAGVGQTASNLIATFVQSQTNIACSDVRISRKSVVGDVFLEDSGTTTDILAAFGALPLTTSPVNYGDYSLICSIVNYVDEDLLETNYLKLTSPTAGANSQIIIKKTFSDFSRDATAGCFGLDFISDAVDEYTCWGQRTLTIIYRDTLEEDFGDFIYEHGSINFNPYDPAIVYLNYLKSTIDTIRLGNYYTENFADTEPEWKLPALRLYNTIYKLDPDSADPEAEIIDDDVTDMMVKFTHNEVSDNSIYVIEEDVLLTESTPPTIDSVPLASDISGLTAGKFIKLSINDNVFIKVSVDTNTTPTSLVNTLNSNWTTQANELELGSIPFATLDDSITESQIITLTVDNFKNNGKIVIYDDEGGLIGADFFDTTTGENTNVWAGGDYYLELFQPQFDSVPALTEGEIALLTPEELFGYINMKLITGRATNVPDLAFNAHMINDRRHKFLKDSVYTYTTDEDDLQNQLYPYKIAGVDNSFQIPIFSTFDVIAEIFITSAAAQERVKENVEDALRTYYSLENTILSQNVNKSEFISIVLGVSGVRYINITYFGHDMIEQVDFPNQDIEIVADFDEILVLSDDVFSTSGEQTHGLVLNYGTL